MEKTEEKKNELSPTGGNVEEAVLKFLADNNPDDEAALEDMVRTLQGELPGLVEVVYKGLHYDSDVEKADADGYLRGRNEAVEQKRQEEHGLPRDDGGSPTDYDLPLLRSIRRSVWD